MNQTPTYRSAPHAPRCTNATVEALTGTMPSKLLLYGTSVLQALSELGYDVEFMPYEHKAYKTLRGLSKNPPKGSWYLVTSGHALALVDGVLTDTEDRGFDLRRLQCMFHVTKR